MPNRRPKPSFVLGAVAALAVASPLAVYSFDHSTSGVRAANESQPASPTEIAQMVLAAAPDVVVPLKQLTGLPLPDLRLSDLKKLPLPSSIPVPYGTPAPPGVQLPDRIELPDLSGKPGNIAQTDGLPLGLNSPVDLDKLRTDVSDQLGASVKEVTQNKMFSMVALTASDIANADAKIRAKLPDGTWSPWMATDPILTNKTDKTPNGKGGTEPLYVGDTNTVQILVTRKAPVAQSAPAPALPPLPPMPTPPTGPNLEGAPLGLGYAPAAFSTPLHADPIGDDAPAAPEAAPEDATAADPVAAEDAPVDGPSDDDLSAQLISPGTSPEDATLSDIAQPVAAGGPKVISRAQWGADESMRCQDPTYNDFIGGATVHHSAGSNDYTKAQSAGIVRAIYKYHAKTLGWCDIGYNALVDKYGQIFEGRFGGLDKPVEGAHAGGFNENTVGVAMLGNFDKVAPSAAELDATGKFIGWRLKSANLDPKGHTTMYSEGTSYTSYKEGQAVKLPIIFAHRDVDNTDCPGDAAYAKMDEIRDIAAAEASGNKADAVSDPAPAAAAPADPAPPVDAAPADAAPPADPATKLVSATDADPIAQKWVSTGGPTGPLGAALSGLLPTKNGQQYAKFANGNLYTTPTSGVVTVAGKILQQFIQLGLDSGVLGDPLSGEYPVPDGVKADFEQGSLIFNQATGFVQTILKTYNNAYEDAYNNPKDAAAPVVAPPPPPAPVPAEPLPADPPPAG